MSEIALDAICDASARSKYEQFLSMLKNSAIFSALQCGVFDKFRFSIIILNECCVFSDSQRMSQKNCGGCDSNARTH